MATQAEVAEFLGLSDRHVRRLVDKRVLPKAKRGEYDLKTCVQFYIHHVSGSNPTPENEGIDLMEEKARETRERADQLAIKNANLRGELAPIELVEWTISKACAQIAAILETIPAKLKRAMPSLGAKEVEIIKKEIVKIQNIAADAEINFDEYSDGNDSQAEGESEARE